MSMKGGVLFVLFVAESQVPGIHWLNGRYTVGALEMGATVITKLFFFWSFCLFRAVPAAYGGSQARSPVGAASAGLHDSSRKCWILYPLSKARVRTCVLMHASQVC